MSKFDEQLFKTSFTMSGTVLFPPAQYPTAVLKDVKMIGFNWKDLQKLPSDWYSPLRVADDGSFSIAIKLGKVDSSKFAEKAIWEGKVNMKPWSFQGKRGVSITALEE